MDSNGASAGGVGPGSAGGSTAIAASQGGPNHFAWGAPPANDQLRTNSSGNAAGPPMDIQQILQQQQNQQLMMAAAAAAGQQQGGPAGNGQAQANLTHAGLVGQQLGLPQNQQQPTLNMMLQGMAAAAAGHPGSLHHALQSPPNSNAAAINPAGGYLFLPQNPNAGMQGQQMHPGRDLSPNSTPGLQNQQQPPPAATPPNQLLSGGIDLMNESQRQPQWHHQITANQNFLLGGGPRIMNPGATLAEKMSMEEQLKQHGGGGQFTDMFSPHNPMDAFQGLRGSVLNDNGGGNHPAGQLTLNQMHDLAMARTMVPASGQMGHGAYVPAQSPPTLFQQQMPQPMPPRPRPEGGQDSSPTFLNEQSDINGSMNGGINTNMNGSTMNIGGIKKDPADLIIGSWNDEDAEKVQQQQQMNHMQQYQSLPPSFGGGNGGGQQGQLGQMQQPAQHQQQQAFMMHQQQIHNQRLIDEGLMHGIQGQGTGKNMLDNTTSVATHGSPTTGWGEPPTPSSHAPNNWGATNMGPQVAHTNMQGGSGTPPNMHTGLGGGSAGLPPNVMGDGMSVPHKDGNWGNSLYSAPPPSHLGGSHGGGAGTGGMHFESQRGRGAGGGRGNHLASSGFGHSAGPTGVREPYGREGHISEGAVGPHQSDRGGFGGRGRGAMNRGSRGGRGGGSYGGPPLDHSQEKNAGRKSAIAETIAMMNKMKMEDKEKKVTSKKWVDERRERNKDEATVKPNNDDLQNENDGISDEPLHRRNQRERENRNRGTTTRGGPANNSGGPRGGGRGGMGHGGTGGVNMFIPPGAGAGGGIPPFPGLDNFLPPGAGPVPVAPAFGGHPGGFPGGYPGGPHVPGGHPANLYHLGPGPMNFGPGGPHPAMAGPYGGRGGGPGFPPRGGRGGPMGFGRGFPGPGGPMLGIRGPMGVGPRGRGGGYRGARGGGTSISKGNDTAKTEVEQGDKNKNDEKNSGNAADEDYELDDPAIVGASISIGTADEDAEKAEEPSKNLNSGQGKKGQLALLASETPKELRGTRKSIKQKQQSKIESSVLLLKNTSESESNLRERLIRQLVGGEAECMVCLDKIKPKNATWDCQQCYQVFHIHCIKKWGKCQEVGEGLRCPGCQKVWQMPKSYRCFCRKLLEPVYDRNEIPHSCGEVCGKELRSSDIDTTNKENVLDYKACPHKCLELCHPGPCPPCNASVVHGCPCGKSRQTGRCGKIPLCNNICAKKLNCGLHDCIKTCHRGDCGKCEEKITQSCFCERKSSRQITCSEELVGDTDEFSCGMQCEIQLNCKNHNCLSICHSGICQQCPLSPTIIDFCHCGKTEVRDILPDGRKSCLEAIPTCKNRCEKSLRCGSPSEKHACTEFCHEATCPVCPLISKVRCRCGFMDKEVPCRDLLSRPDDVLCDKRCTKKRTCGRHKCGRNCCIEIDHICTLVCGKLLSCSSHRCDDQCHRGDCRSCPNVSFDELPCQCGSQIAFPPIQCGAKPPTCDNPCPRNHECAHRVRHPCHSDAQCPPCTELTEKWCHGKHELRKNVVCHLEVFSCGKPCGLPLPCGKHPCVEPCHSGQCLKVAVSSQDSNDANKSTKKCTQPCKNIRDGCGHACGANCHDGTCPNTLCSEQIKAKCVCGSRTATVICSENEKEHQRIRTSQLASKMADIASGNSIDLTDIFYSVPRNEDGVLKTKLECNENCSIIERNRRLALALQIENPELTTKVAPPKYSDTLKEMVKKDRNFVQSINKSFEDLVKLAKESKQKSRSHSFECMNKEKRQVVHDLAGHFGCTAEAYDAEPKRNVVATAVKGQVWLPTMSVVDVVQGVRKAPAPASSSASTTITTSTMSSFSEIAKTVRS